MSDATTEVRAEADTRFRAEVRAWLEAHCPAAMRLPLRSDDEACWGGRRWTFRSEAQRLWFEAMRDRGWTAPRLPRKYGGGGLSPEEAQVLAEEMRGLGCRPPLSGWATTLLGPTLVRFGTEDQRRRFLPPMIRGEERWCQGFSEPEAGSDLASLRMRAERQGDVYVVTGQKVWTTYGRESDWMFCLVRTDADAPKHEGISFLLVDLESPGVSFRNIPLISGRSEFYETRFDAVEVPVAQRVGAENQGWDLVRFLLEQERQVSGAVKAQGVAPLMASLPGREGEHRGLDVGLRRDFARFDADALALEALLQELSGLGEAPAAEAALSSVIKYFGAELNKRRFDLLMRAGGLEALACESPWTFGDLASTWLRSRGNSIAGGSNEMQFNMIARRVLGLPRY